MDAVVFHFGEQSRVVNLIKGFGEIKKDCIYLARLVEAVEEVSEGVKKLGFTAPMLSKAVLEVGQDVVGV